MTYTITNLIKENTIVPYYTLQINGNYYTYTVFTTYYNYKNGITTLQQYPDANYRMPPVNTSQYNKLINERVNFAIPMDIQNPELSILRFKSYLLLS